MIAIQWHERVAADSDQLEFEVGAPDISIQNSSTLRLAGFQPEKIQHPALAGGGSAHTTWLFCGRHTNGGGPLLLIKPQAKFRCH